MEDLEKLAFMSGVLADLAKKASESDDMQLVTSALELFLIFKVGDKLEDKKALLPVEKLAMQQQILFKEYLNGAEKKEWNGQLISAELTERFELDSAKLLDYFVGQGNMTEAEMKSLLYSHKFVGGKPKLKKLK